MCSSSGEWSILLKNLWFIKQCLKFYKDKILLLENGGSDRSPLIQMPAALSYPMNMKKYDWGFTSDPEPNLNNRRLATPRGNVIGGSSSINGMVFVRGHARDFDNCIEPDHIINPEPVAVLPVAWLNPP